MVLDASGFTFADSRLLNPLIPTHRTVDLRVAAPTRQLCRLLAITGVDALLTVRSTVEEAAACWAPRSAWPSSPYSEAGRCSPSARLSAPPFRPVASGYRPVGPGRWPGCRGQPEEGGAGVGLRAIATFDVSTGGGVGHGLATWFGAALAGPLRGRLEQEQQGTAFFSASTRATERSPRQEYQPLATGWEAMREELLHEPETAHVLYMREHLGKPLVHVRSSTTRVRRPNAEAQLLFGADCGSLDDAGFCADAVEFLVAALDTVNPAFAWLGADAPASEETNLDWVLGRRVRDSVREARKLLRGYSWTTVCPEELSVRLGGPGALAATGAFHRVVPLSAGGVVLQATETVAGYTDEAVRGVFEALHPVLPPGVPQFDPAHPELRYFPADASRFGG
ncbi:hypothetical protein RGQ21_10280 [Kitasatospora aureofaciens]|nr:hypothetical protein RGQ21_10280 [Kitasatospora aureofaciens]